MDSVFSCFIIECHYNYLLATQPQKKDIIIPTVSEAMDGWISRPDLICNPFCPQIFMSLHPEDEVADKNVFNRICANNNLRDVERWVTKNILLSMRKDLPKTTNVKLRITAGMLNRLVNKRYITNEENIYMFNNIVKNAYELRRDMLYADLPF